MRTPFDPEQQDRSDSFPSQRNGVDSAPHPSPRRTREMLRHIREYEKLLREVHPGFYARLLDRAPDITPMELRTCMLTRLHLPIKETATLLELTTSSVESHRSHARIKLRVQRQQSLTSVLHAI